MLQRVWGCISFLIFVMVALSFLGFLGRSVGFTAESDFTIHRIFLDYREKFWSFGRSDEKVAVAGIDLDAVLSSEADKNIFV